MTGISADRHKLFKEKVYEAKIKKIAQITNAIYEYYRQKYDYSKIVVPSQQSNYGFRSEVME